MIKKIPIHKLIILDKKLAGLSGDYACVYQDFESDIFNALLGLKDRISNYKVIKLVFNQYLNFASAWLKKVWVPKRLVTLIKK
ncbi:MAG: hypothetical protein IPN72_15485 [Saprospiraceae bacterium]|nr:hypothetical protein [Saprospiraceae bacterium]